MFPAREHLFLVNLLNHCALSVRARLGAFGVVSVCTGGVSVVFGRVRVVFRCVYV